MLAAVKADEVVVDVVVVVVEEAQAQIEQQKLQKNKKQKQKTKVLRNLPNEKSKTNKGPTKHGLKIIDRNNKTLPQSSSNNNAA